MHVAEFEGFNSAMDGDELNRMVEQKLGAGWERMIRETKRNGQEQTLIFVPKILAIFVTLLLALPFMADSLHSHMMRISSRIIGG